MDVTLRRQPPLARYTYLQVLTTANLSIVALACPALAYINCITQW